MPSGEVAQASSLWLLDLARTNPHRLEACATKFSEKELARQLTTRLFLWNDRQK
jgi:hypothetical protein